MGSESRGNESEERERRSKDRDKEGRHRDRSRVREDNRLETKDRERRRDRSSLRVGDDPREERHRDRSRTRGEDDDGERRRDRSRVRDRLGEDLAEKDRPRDRSRVRDRLGEDLAEKDRPRDRSRARGEEKDKDRHRDRSRIRSEKDKDSKEREKDNKDKDKKKDKEKKEKKEKRSKRDTLTVDTSASYGGSSRPSSPGANPSDVDTRASPVTSQGTGPVVTDRRFNPANESYGKFQSTPGSDNYGKFQSTPGYQPTPGYHPQNQGSYSPVSPISPALHNKYGAYPPPSPNPAPYNQNSQFPAASFPPAQSYPPPPAPQQHPPPASPAIYSNAPPGNIPPGPPPPPPNQSPYQYGMPPPAPPPPMAHSLQSQYQYDIPLPPPPPPPPATAIPSPQPQYKYDIPPAPPPPPPGQFSPGLQSYPAMPPIQGENPDYAPVEHSNPEYWSPDSTGNSKPPAGGLGLHHISSTGLPPPPPLSPSVGPHYQSAMASPPSPGIGPHYGAYPQSPQQMPGGYSQLTSPISPTGHGHGHGHSNSLSIPGAMAGLSLNTNLGPGGASPALLPYQGTYQSISPMPSPTFGPGSSPYSPPGMLDHHYSIGPPRLPTLIPPSKQVEEEYDPLPDAKALLTSLNHVITRVDPEPIIRILPKLTPSQLVALRAEYKHLYHKVNIAKHIKMQVGGALGKIAWAVALGPYESEGWWANSWYQKAVTRNELIIEALVGKSVQEIREIKKGFRDAKHGNSLEKAVKSELESHKFRTLILMCLNTTDGIRDEEPENGGYLGSVQGHILANPQSVRMDKVQDDVRRLFDILRLRPGSTAGSGEMTLMEIILCRNDVHLREVIRWYRQQYGKDLSKIVLDHSQNLVGEALTHRLAGLIDKPLRDAKLLDNALSGILKAENPKDDLFISRIVRAHWDKEHLERVKTAYAVKYKVDLVKRVQAATSGTFREFLVRMLS